MKYNELKELVKDELDLDLNTLLYTLRNNIYCDHKEDCYEYRYFSAEREDEVYLTESFNTEDELVGHVFKIITTKPKFINMLDKKYSPFSEIELQKIREFKEKYEKDITGDSPEYQETDFDLT